VARVARISIAPVKALGLVHPQEVELRPTGVDGDRRFWLVSADGRLVNGKAYPRLMRVRPEWDETSRRLALRFPDGALAEGIVDPGEPVAAVMYGEPHPSRLSAKLTGRGKELLIGFLFAMAILVPIYLAYFLISVEAER